MHLTRPLLVWGCLLFLWASLIFLLSHQPGSGAAWEPPLWYVLERKSAHVFEYAILMLLAFRFFRLTFCTETFARVLAFSAVFALAYGATDELHQFFIFGRGAKFTDMAVDGVGVVLASVLLIVRAEKRRNI